MQLTRKIPLTMFSQHPDNAHIPYWHTSAYVKTHHELHECYLMYKDLGAQEMMWDWEGKLVDESVVERLLGSYPEFFRDKPLGKELFLTFRIPNPRVESGYRLGRAFMVILSSHHLTHTTGLHDSPLFEVILPLTESAAEMVKIQTDFKQIAAASAKAFGQNRFTKKELEIIPIFESVTTLLASGNILRDYIALTQNHQGTKPGYLRPFCARSDPALNSGIIPTTLAIKWALSEYAKLSDATGILTYPIIAPGALPFRGGLTPEKVQTFLQEFNGIRTIVIQSSFRYDYPLPEVNAALNLIQKQLPDTKTQILPAKILPQLRAIIPWFELPYRHQVKSIAPFIEKLSPYIPQRRERIQHIGLFGYSRQVGDIKLPRAIGFTASCYSLGLPPELFGMGSGLATARKKGKLKLIESLYKELKPALIEAGRLLRKESIKELSLPDWEKEIRTIEDYVGEKLGPKTISDGKHQQLTADITGSLLNGGPMSEKIQEAAELRRSLG